MLPHPSSIVMRLQGAASFAESRLKFEPTGADDAGFGIELCDDGLRRGLGTDECGVVPLNGEDVRFGAGHSADNELQIDREVNHVSCLQGSALKRGWRQVDG